MKLSLFVKTHWFFIATIVILLLATVLRFYAYNDRWGLAYDQAHDALVAREALHQHKIPMLGPFSSAGPFVTGPEWYWFIIGGTILYPSAVITPWIVLTVMFIVFVYLLIVIGKQLGGEFFAICAGLFATVSSAEVSQGSNLANQSPLAFLSALTLFAILRYFKTKNPWYLFLNGLCVAIGINTHLQGVLLIPLFLIPMIAQKPTIKGIVLSFVGFVLPFIPLLLFDSTHHFYDLRSMWQYYHHDQYAISLDQLGRNWKNYLFIFWPKSLAYIIGGYVWLSYLFILLLGIILFLNVRVRKIPKLLLVVLIALLVSILFMRYTRTPLFDSYLTFLHPWILLIAAWVTSFCFSKNKIAGILFLILLVSGSLIVDINEIRTATNATATQVTKFEQLLQKKLPGEKFKIYDYNYETTRQSVPLVLFLDTDQKISDNGMTIGMVIATPGATFSHPVITGKKGQYQLFDLSNSSSEQLKKEGWILVNPSRIYHETQEWYIDKKL